MNINLQIKISDGLCSLRAVQNPDNSRIGFGLQLDLGRIFRAICPPVWIRHVTAANDLNINWKGAEFYL